MAELSFVTKSDNKEYQFKISTHATGVTFACVRDGYLIKTDFFTPEQIQALSEIAKHGEKSALDSQLKKAGTLATQTADTLKSVLQHMPNASREEIKAKIKEVIQPKEIALAVINGHLDAAIKGEQCSACGLTPSQPLHICPRNNTADELCNCCVNCEAYCKAIK